MTGATLKQKKSYKQSTWKLSSTSSRRQMTKAIMGRLWGILGTSMSTRCPWKLLCFAFEWRQFEGVYLALWIGKQTEGEYREHFNLHSLLMVII